MARRTRKRSTSVEIVNIKPSRTGPVAENRLRLWVSAVLALFTLLALCPVRTPKNAGSIDPSWGVAINYAHTHGLTFGKDVAFTYGPLGYLSVPKPFGTNLAQGIALQLIAWATLGVVLAWLVLRKRIPLMNWCILAVCAPAGAQLFHASPTDGPDYFLEFLAILLVATCSSGSIVFYAGAVTIAAILLLIKMSAGVAVFGLIVVFALAVTFTDHVRVKWPYWIGIIAVPAILAITFLLFCGSSQALVTYLRSGIEISSGYSAAVSVVGPYTPLYAALIMLLGFALLAAALYLKRDNVLPAAVAILAPLFLEFKHSFVRQDGHVEIFFKLAPLALGALLLFVDLKPKRLFSGYSGYVLVAAVALIAMPWLFAESGSYYYQYFDWEPSDSPFSNVENVGALMDFPAFERQARASQDQDFSATGHLPPELLSRVGDHSIAIYPVKMVYAAMNPIRFTPFPVIQAYSAYTPYLDGWDAEFLDNPRRPDFVLFEWHPIDGRHPLLDCPQTALALYRNYEFDSAYGTILLLHARSKPLPSGMQLVERTTMTLGKMLDDTKMAMGQPLHFATRNPISVRVFLDYTLQGRLADLFFRVPPVYAILSGPQKKAYWRIPPRVISGGIPLSLIPLDLEDTRKLFETGRTEANFDTIAISGPGAASFSPTARVEIYELSGLR